MQITLQYETQLKRALGMSSETVDVAEGTEIAAIVKSVATRHGEAARAMLIDGDGQLRSSVLIFAGDRQVTGADTVPLAGGETLTLMTPISGG